MKKLKTLLFSTKRRLIITITAVMLISWLTMSYSVGSSRSDKYHRPYCEWAEKIKPENKERFVARWHARAAGHVPCRKCHPVSSSWRR